MCQRSDTESSKMSRLPLFPQGTTRIGEEMLKKGGKKGRGKGSSYFGPHHLKESEEGLVFASLPVQKDTTGKELIPPEKADIGGGGSGEVGQKR